MTPDRDPRSFFQSPRAIERIEADVDEELAFDLEMRVRDLVERGVDPREARRRAVEESGDLAAARLSCVRSDRAAQRSARLAVWLSGLVQDTRLALRGAWRAPGFALVVLLTLALGVGANTAVFSVVHKVLLERLPYREPDRLVRLYGGRSTDPPEARRMLTGAEVLGLQASGLFSDLAAFGMYGGLTWVGEETAEVWGGAQVEPTFFRVLGVPPLLGRFIEERDVGPDAVPVAVLGHALWLRVFGGDPAVVGRTVQLSGRAHQVIGVMSADFVAPERDPELWTPLDLRLLAPYARMHRVVGRLSGPLDPVRLRAGFDAVAARAAPQDPDGGRDVILRAVPLAEDMVGDVRPVLMMIMGAAALVLSLASLNLAGLFLARATAQRRRWAVRTALGAGRGRILRQQATESAVFALAGCALGVGVAFSARRVLVEFTASLLPSMRDAPLDGAVLAFAVAVSLASAVVFGAVPALAATRVEAKESLAERGRDGARGPGRSGARDALVGIQIALAVILLVAAGLLGRTFLGLQRTGVGFDTGPELLTFRVNLSAQRYVDADLRAQFHQRFRERLGALPGVRAVGAIEVSAWNGFTAAGPDSFAVLGGPSAANPGEAVSRVTVSTGYFEALGIPVLGGRAFLDSDREGAPLVAIVSRSLADRHWPEGTPRGAQVRIGGAAAPALEVVGVVGDVRPSPIRDVEPALYVPMSQHPPTGAEFVVRAAGNARALVPALRAVLHDEDPALPLVAPRTLQEVFAGMLVAQRFALVFLAAFGGMALVLASLGVYGVTAYSVTARRRELGIRIALGSRRAGVLGLVLKRGMAVALAGTATGTFGALAGVRLIRGLLVGVTPYDPLAFTAATLTLLAVSALASLVPALGATRVRPIDSLRCD